MERSDTDEKKQFSHVYLKTYNKNTLQIDPTFEVSIFPAISFSGEQID